MNKWPAEVHAAQLSSPTYRDSEKVLGLKKPSSGWGGSKQRIFKWSEQIKGVLTKNSNIVIQWYDGETRKGGITVTHSEIQNAIKEATDSLYVTISTLRVEKRVIEKISEQIEKAVRVENEIAQEELQAQDQMTKQLDSFKDTDILQ